MTMSTASESPDGLHVDFSSTAQPAPDHSNTFGYTTTESNGNILIGNAWVVTELAPVTTLVAGGFKGPKGGVSGGVVTDRQTTFVTPHSPQAVTTALGGDLERFHPVSKDLKSDVSSHLGSEALRSLSTNLSLSTSPTTPFLDKGSLLNNERSSPSNRLPSEDYAAIANRSQSLYRPPCRTNRRLL